MYTIQIRSGNTPRRLAMLSAVGSLDLMTTVNDNSDVPRAEEIRAAVECIVASPSFRRSPQLVAFLRFVVESVLGGKAEHIKSYTIGVEALGRCERFDPQVDPIVRVEAARMRKALASYYAGEGAGRPVTIEIPLGSYVPVFRRRKTYRWIAILIAILMRTLRIIRVPSRANPSRSLMRDRRESGVARAVLGRSSTS
jgi:hypothetical protein